MPLCPPPSWDEQPRPDDDFKPDGRDDSEFIVIRPGSIVLTFWDLRIGGTVWDSRATPTRWDVTQINPWQADCHN